MNEYDSTLKLWTDYSNVSVHKTPYYRAEHILLRHIKKKKFTTAPYQKQFRKTLRQLLINISVVDLYQWHGLVFSKRNMDGHSDEQFDRMLDILQKNGYIHFCTGRLGTWVTPYPSFRELFKLRTVPARLEIENLVYIQYKDKDKNIVVPDVEYEGFGRTKQILDKWHSRLIETKVEFFGRPAADVELYRSMIVRDGRFEGGRLYPRRINECFNWMYVSKRTDSIRNPFGVENPRLHITIDDEPVAEIDYCSLHPHFVHHNWHVECPDDPYCLDLDPIIGADGAAYSREVNDRIRKKMWQCIFNNDSRSRALFAVGNIYKKDEDLTWDTRIVDRDFYIDQCLERNRGAEHCFYKKIGVKMQLTDSELMLNILERCLDAGVFVLPVHDSIVCPASQTDFCDAVMDEEYTKMCLSSGLKPWTCPRKRKQKGEEQ